VAQEAREPHREYNDRKKSNMHNFHTLICSFEICHLNSNQTRCRDAPNQGNLDAKFEANAPTNHAPRYEQAKFCHNFFVFFSEICAPYTKP